MAIRNVLILGGYGNFGKRIAESLSSIDGITILIAGRDLSKAQKLSRELSSKANAVAGFKAVVIDINGADFLSSLKALTPHIVIHTGGPFQGQDYRVPQACIELGSHYIDLADDRRFVCDIASLNDQALAQGVLAVSGASSVPGLSSTVIDSFMDEFSRLDEIDFAIAPGNKAERGEATVKAILSYTGHSFKVFEDGAWTDKFGWMSPRKLDFGNAIGKRWLANIDIPDLELFPERYKSVKTVKFQAGLELAVLHFGMVFMAWLAKIGLIKDWSVLIKPIFKSSEVFKGLGSDDGGMQINLSGLDEKQRLKHIKWMLSAENGVGPYIPTISAIILAKKLISGDMTTTGAMPCLGLFTMSEFNAEAETLGIYHQVEKQT